VTRTPLILVAVAVALGAAGARAQDRDPVAEVAARAAERGVPPAAVVGPVEDARSRGLPAAAVADKVLEGLAKGVPPERIDAVARALVGRLAEADLVLQDAAERGLAPPRDRPAALADLAHALAGGVDRAAARDLVDAARAGRHGADGVVAAALAVGTLARRGVPVADALPLGRALAREPRSAREVASAFDAWRSAGGRDARAFLGDAERRVSEGRPVAGVEREDAARERARERREERGRMGDGMGGEGMRSREGRR
jgi:hypothetical protein